MIESLKDKVKKSGHSVSFLSLVFLLFLGLKLTGVIDWSWWYITMPLWGGYAVILGLFFLIGFLSLFGFGIFLLLKAFSKK